ncbi:MAG: 50S ribosomal protein L31e [Candidatus Hydrothermarchaeota archaeon]|nr:MAG: 50S ribosomal protein L31e [Candidatus Hydrothermarchaeota archaeon]
MEKGERVYIIPLREVKKTPRRKRAAKAMRYIRKFLERHTKNENIIISNELNEEIWKNGIENIPSKVKVKVSVQEDGSLLATLGD